MEAAAATNAPNVVNLTEPAASHVRSLLTEQREAAGKQLRLYVQAGGCCGMQYGIVFDEKRADDLTVECHGVSVLVDPFSANYLHGAVVDYTETPAGGGFTITNPNATERCGCGKSFEAQWECQQADTIPSPATRDGKITFNLHWCGYGKACKHAGTYATIAVLTGGFHDYGLVQTPEVIKLNEEVGKWGDDITPAELPDPCEIDYVRVCEMSK